MRSGESDPRLGEGIIRSSRLQVADDLVSSPRFISRSLLLVPLLPLVGVLLSTFHPSLPWSAPPHRYASSARPSIGFCACVSPGLAYHPTVRYMVRPVFSVPSQVLSRSRNYLLPCPPLRAQICPLMLSLPLQDHRSRHSSIAACFLTLSVPTLASINLRF